MRAVLVLMMVSFSISAFAADEIRCAANDGVGIDREYIEKQVAKASCYEASRIVESCATGGAMDVLTTGFAIDVCDKATGRLSAADKELKARMLERCKQVCDERTDGLMCISQPAFCRLNVSRFLYSVRSNEN